MSSPFQIPPEADSTCSMPNLNVWRWVFGFFVCFFFVCGETGSGFFIGLEGLIT